jgi:hypothetical protein
MTHLPPILAVISVMLVVAILAICIRAIDREERPR